MECPRCGTTNENTRQFCSNCGTPIASNMLDPIDFGKTQANPVVVEPIEPMPREEKLKNTSIIPIVSEEVQAEIPIDLEEEKEKELERTAIRESLLVDSNHDDLKVGVKQIEKVKKPKSIKKKKPVILILTLVVLFLICILGVVYYLLKKDIIKFNKTEETTITTTTQVNVQLDTELKATSNEVILNSTSHILKYSYEITKTETGYSPVIKLYLDNNQLSDGIIQNNSYNLNELYTSLLRTNIFTIEEQIIKGTDKEYYYINIFINEKYYVFILNDTTCIYQNVTGMFNTKDPDYIYNNKSSLIKNGQYAYIKENDEVSGIEQLSTIANDVVTFTDGEVIGGFWK